VNLPRLAIHRPIGTVIVFTVILLVGLSALAGLPIDLLPDISFARLTVSTTYPGAGPEEVENLVTRIIEEAVSTVAGVQDVFSTSSEGRSSVTAVFPSGTDVDAAANDLRAAIERVRRRLPDGADPPVVFKFDPSQFPIVQLGLVARDPRLQVADLQQLAEDQILFRLERIRGMAQAALSGGVRRRILVELDQGRLRALGLSERDVLNALAAANLAAPAGEVTEGTRRLGLRALSRYEHLDQIRRTVVTTRNRVPVHVADLATVSEGTEEPTGLVRVNGAPGVLLSIQRQPGVNTVAVSDAVLAEVRRLNATLPGAALVVIGDNARFIRRTIHSVREATAMGGALAVAVLFLFLRDLRTVAIIGVTIPIAVLASFALMYGAGYSLNLMTLGALALAVGMLVDASIVVLENIFRHREAGRARRDAAVAGTQEVVSPIVASTVTSVVVFLPIIVIRGEAVTTQLYYQFAVVVVFALACSLLVAMALTPVLASWLPPLRRHEERPWTVALNTRYREVLRWALRHRPVVLGGAAALFILALATFPLIGREILPPTDEGEILVIGELPVGTRLELTEQALARLEAQARRMAPEIEAVTRQIGSAGFGGRSHRGILRIRLRPKGERARTTEAVAAALRGALQLPGGRVVVRPSAGALNILRFSQVDDPIAVEIRGHDLDQGMALARQVQQVLEQIPGVTDVSLAREELIPEAVLRIDVERAAAFGLTPSRVAEALRTAVGGGVATIFRRGGRETDVVVRLREGDRRSPLDVLALPILTPTGQQITLAQVARLERGLAPASIFRRSRQRVTTVTAGLSGRDYGSVMAEVRARLAGLPLPDGFALTFGDAYEEQQRATRQLVGGFLAAVVLVYAVMAVQFEALLEPLLIMGAVPFALGGSLLALFLTGTTLNIQSLTGLIVLVGVVVNNAIVLMDFILARHRREGRPLFEGVVEASAARLRPVLMTTLTTVLGLVPIAIGFGEGAELQAPLARSVLGGMLLSTLVTLVLIPTSYVSVELLRQRWRGRRAVPAPVPAQPLPVTGGGDGPEADEPRT
jgi:HAE1 family hydrophobic/amphiphilic exporter-1